MLSTNVCSEAVWLLFVFFLHFACREDHKNRMWPSMKNPILRSGPACVLLESYILSVTRVGQFGWCLEVATSICICSCFDGPLGSGSLATPPRILSDFDLHLMFSFDLA